MAISLGVLTPFSDIPMLWKVAWLLSIPKFKGELSEKPWWDGAQWILVVLEMIGTSIKNIP